MKRVISMIMALAILALAAIAYAEGNTQENVTNGMQQPEQTQSGPMAGGPGRENRPDGQPPQMPGANDRNQQGQPPQMPSGDQNGSGQNGQPPQMPGTNGRNQQGQPPQMPSGDQNGSGQNSQSPELPGSEKPEMIDFDAMVAKGVISQDTCDKIKAYMEEHKPADMPGSQPPAGAPEAAGEKPAEDQTAPEKPGGEKPSGTPETGGGLPADLLKDGVITQAEYDALIAAQTAGTT